MATSTWKASHSSSSEWIGNLKGDTMKWYAMNVVRGEIFIGDEKYDSCNTADVLND